MSGVNVSASTVAVVAGVGAVLYFGSRLIPQTENRLNFASEENVFNASIEHVTGFSLHNFGDKLGGWVYEATH